MNNTAWTTGFIFGLLIVAAICFIMGYRKKEFGHDSNEYDERQNIVRGQAFKLAYITAIGLAVAGGILDAIFDLRWIGLFTFAMTILWFSMCVFTTYAILHDAYFTLRKRRKPMTLIFLILGAVNAALAIDGIVHDGWLADGSPSKHCTNLLIGLSCCYLGCVMLFKAYLDRKAADEE